MTTINSDYLNAALCDMGRRSLYDYCRIRHPKSYTRNRPHAKILCDTIQAFIDDKLIGADGKPIERLMINLPPRHLKSFSAINATQWYLGNYPNMSSIIVSYNSILSGRFSKAVRDGMQEIKASQKLVYSDFFPNVKIKRGDASYEMWSIEGSHFSFMSTSPGATLTGVGTKLLIIDDLIKSAEEAYNERILEEHWDWYVDTALSRLENGAKQLIIMTRWSSMDLCGRLLDLEPEKWHVIKMPAYNDETGEMLAPDILNHETFLDRRKKTDPSIFDGNYQQSPRDGEDKLYTKFNTYIPETLPQEGLIESYFDTADMGDDYLAGAVYRIYKNTAYILDLIYTQEPMEVTEQKTAAMLANFKADKAIIESNNGGRGFARNVERIMREVIGYSDCGVTWFHQGENKQARILSQATNVMNGIVFPHDWADRWPDFYRDTMNMSRMSKWLHEDNADMMTGIVEKSLSPEIVRVYGKYSDEDCAIEQPTITTKDTIYIAQDFADGFFRPVTFIVQDGKMIVVNEFEPQQMIEAPKMIRDAYPDNPIVWYLDIGTMDVFPAYRQAILDQRIQLQVGTISPSPVERPVIINKLFMSDRLKISRNCNRAISAISSRIIDRDGKPEKGDGAMGIQYICTSFEYGVYRIASSQPVLFGAV